MEKPIYFTKIEYTESLIYDSTRIILNLPERELSLQVFDYERQMPAVKGICSEELHGKVYTFEANMPAKVIRSGKSDFKPELLIDEQQVQRVVFSYGIKLSDEQMAELLPLCNALNFEPYRGRKMSMDDEGYVGYRDEIGMRFCAVTDSHIPYIELPMSYYYDEEHEWPSERLYRHLVVNILKKHPKTSKWITSYGGCSLFC